MSVVTTDRYGEPQQWTYKQMNANIGEHNLVFMLHSSNSCTVDNLTIPKGYGESSEGGVSEKDSSSVGIPI